MADPNITLDAPPKRRPRKGGLLSVVDDIRQVDRLAVASSVQYQAGPCHLAFDQIELCFGAYEQTTDKAPQGIEWAEGIGPNFGAYYAVQCFLQNGSTEEYSRIAREGLELNEGRILEAHLAAYFGTLTPAPAASLMQVIASLDNQADDTYAGMPILHLGRARVVEAAALGLVFTDDTHTGQLWTANGTPVVASSQYADALAVVTGDITIVESAPFVNAGYELGKNLEIAIAEKVYGIVVDCDYAVAATIS